MKRKSTRPLLMAGTSTLLLIFLSLCLLTFAVLSFLSARADLNLSTKTAERTSAYQEACNAAYGRLAEIDDTLMEIYEKTENSEEYYSSLEGLLEDYIPDSQTVSFSVPLGEEQFLCVELNIHYPHPGETFYTISQWQTVNTADWTPDTRQNVYIQPGF